MSGDELAWSVAAEAEANLVSALILHPDAIVRVGRLVADDFFSPPHRVVFEALTALADRGVAVDLVTLQDEVHRRGMLEAIGGMAHLAGYMLRVPTADNIGHYAAIIRDYALARRLSLAASGAVSRLGAGADWREELDLLKQALEEAEGAGHVESPTLKQAMVDEVASIHSGGDDEVGLATGLGIERVCPTGIPLDKVTTVFGETGNFKTTLVSNLAWNMAAGGNTVVVVSWEDSTQLAAQRALGRATGVNYGRIAARQLDSDERAKLLLTGGEVADRIVMGDDVEPSIDAVIRMARYYKRTRNAKAVIVDYIQMIDGSGSQKQILDDAVYKAQRAAKRDRMAYIFVSQVKAEVTNRKAEDGGPRPTLDDCLGSSAMRIGSKLGLGVFRPWRYCRIPAKGGAFERYHTVASQWPEGREVFLRDVYPRLLEINVTKNVMGEAPVIVPCLVEPSTGRVEPFEVPT
jgi:replicative DNA helicase